MKSLQSIPLRRVSLSDSRPTIPDTVNSLAGSLGELGLIQPITVRNGPVADGGIAVQGYHVVAGNHRVAAARALGWDEIEAFVLDGEDRLDEEMREIDENLIRAELTASQRAYAIKRRKELWAMRHGEPETGGNTSPTCLSDGRKSGTQHEKQFAADTADRTGQSKRSINEHISRADALGDDLQAVTGTSLDKGVELDALKGMPEPERKALIERAKSGEKVSARKPAKPPSTAFADMILDKIDTIQRHLDSRDMDLDDFERKFLDDASAGSEALNQRLRDTGALMQRLGTIALMVEE